MKVFQITLNDEKNLGITDGASLAAAKRWVRSFVTSTHIGTWHKKTDGYEYCTSIGKYYYFKKVDEKNSAWGNPFHY